MLIIYTDGSCNPRTKQGGWGVIVLENNDWEWHFGGSFSSTTNNRMELLAIIEAIKFSIQLKEKKIKIFTDSLLTINGGKGTWKRNMNLDLWKIYDDVVKKIEVEFEWVKSHNGNEYNEKVDKLAKSYVIK